MIELSWDSLQREPTNILEPYQLIRQLFEGEAEITAFMTSTQRI